ncbi:MAG: aldehyde dehydrogenase family protein [Saprospiraceae bacterium]|nr:aldehyde dehydrogenase family protein [Saprospiraceae bacterium]
MPEVFQTISPVDGRVYVERSYAQLQDIDHTLNQAQQIQMEWQATSIDERAQICRKAVHYLVAHSNKLAQELTWQMGRPIRYTPNEILGGLQERAIHMIDIAASALAEESLEDGNQFKKVIKHGALGTILVLAPWNYPYLTSINAIIPALMAGNTVILKHSQQTPLCAESYADAFNNAGLPAGVFQYLHMTHTQVAKVVVDSRIDFVSFTGSVEGGYAIQEAVGKRFMRTGLELGGKDPAYVRADADLSYCSEQIADGAFFNSGQSCCGVERIYVHTEVYDQFLEAFLSATTQLNLDDPTKADTTLGPMIKPTAAAFVTDQIDAALAMGARPLVDVRSFPNHEVKRGYMAPQVLVDVDHRMSIMQDETFGPAVGIMKVKDDAEAVHLMNDSRYGLTASIWTQDLERGEVLGKSIQTGTLFINRCDYLDPSLAWSGVKDSGIGISLSHLGYLQVTRPKSFHIKK